MPKKQWKNGGDEDKYFMQLVQEGKVHANVKPYELKKDKVFENFSAAVIRNNIRKFKELGVFSNNSKFSLTFLLKFKVLILANDQKILDDQIEEDIKESKTFNDTTHESAVSASFTNSQYPHFISESVDPETQIKKLYIGYAFPGGSKNIDCNLSIDGKLITISYEWPNCAFDPKELFKKALTSGVMTAYDPKIVEMNKTMKKFRAFLGEAPVNKVTIPLPFQVETDSERVKKMAYKRDDGSLYLFVELDGLKNEYQSRENSAQITFNL